MALYGLPTGPQDEPKLWLPRRIGEVSGTSKTPTFPTVPPVGGIVVAAVGTNTSGVPTISGLGATWTLINRQNEAAGTQFELDLFIGIVGDTPTTSITWTWTGTGGAIVACYQCPGLDPAAVISGAGNKQANTASQATSVTRTAARNNGLAAFATIRNGGSFSYNPSTTAWRQITVSNTAVLIMGVWVETALEAGLAYGASNIVAAEKGATIVGLIN